MPNITESNNIDIDIDNVINTNASDELTIKQKKIKKSTVEFDEEGIPILSRQRIYMAVASLCIAIFLASLDGTIIVTALPTMANIFNAADSIHWLITANLLANTCFQPLFGKFSDIFGRKETLIGAIIIFEIGSLISGFAKSISLLIFSRALTGVGAAGLQVMVLVVISEMVPLRERGRYSGLVGVAFGLASVIGPLLGGFLTDKVSYRWCFFINIPIGILAGIFIALLVKTRKSEGSAKDKIKRIDFVGSFLLVSGLVMLLIGLNFGGNEHKWISATVLCTMIIGALTLVAYVYYDLKVAKEPILPLKMFKHRNFWSITTAQFFMGFGLYGIIYAAPSYDSIVHNSTASHSGIFLLPFILGMVILSFAAGLFITYTGRYRPMFISGTFIMAVGCGLLISINENTKGVATASFLAICGIGCGLCMQSFIICVQATVPRNLIASATSTIAFTRILSGTIGTTLSTIVQKSIVKSKITQLIAKFPTNAKVILASLKKTSLIHTSSVPSE
ncbi:hypothetical protein BB561_002367, partial [Smittium simulii]